jgi:hypothetical protein
MNAPVHSRDLFAIDCAVVLRRLRSRGFELKSQKEACDLGPWLRFTPMLQTLLFGLSTITGSVEVLLALAGLLAIGLIAGFHPFDLIYSGVIRPLEKSPELPRCPVRRRLVFLVGVGWCLGTAWAFDSGNQTLGYVLGGLMTASTGLLATTHICIPSLALRWMTGDRPSPGTAFRLEGEEDA